MIKRLFSLALSLPYLLLPYLGQAKEVENPALKVKVVSLEEMHLSGQWDVVGR